MADFTWASRSPIGVVTANERKGATDTERAGVTLTDMGSFSLALVMARRGKAADMSAALSAHFSITPPGQGRMVRAGTTRLIWSGPDQMLVLAPSSSSGHSAEDLRRTLAGAASVSDQSDGRCLFKLSGPHVRETLAKLSSLDFSDDAFPVGSTAVTAVEHTAVNLWREPDDADAASAFCMVVPSSVALCLWQSIIDSGAEYCVALSSAPL